MTVLTDTLLDLGLDSKTIQFLSVDGNGDWFIAGTKDILTTGDKSNSFQWFVIPLPATRRDGHGRTRWSGLLPASVGLTFLGISVPV